MNSSNLCDVNCDPLSDTICSGIPFRANTVRKISIVLNEVIFFIGKTSGHFECASTIMRKFSFKNGPAKSMCILCHGADGHSQGCTGALVGLF